MLGTFPFDKSTTGGALKARISAKEGIDVGSHRFIFGGGKELRDGATLVGQGIIDGQMIVVLKARKSTK
ncbi:MAG TPA: ubiquitin-like domain-containing protein [Chlamydiales bacterium]|nr:ubiquitin-like domain-containing protein [Chlamydiales bacterium]